MNTPKDPLTEPAPWNAVAVAYDEAFSRRLPELVREAIHDLAPTQADVVLDLAAGPGTLTLALAPSVRRVVAVDFAEEMIARLERRARSAGATNVEAHVMDGHALAFPDGAFDAAASMFGWFLFADRARGLAELHRVLRPGARLLVTSWMPPDRNAVLGAMLEALRAVLPDLPRPPGPLPTQIPENVAAELRAGGFANVEVRVVCVPAPFGSVDEFWDVLASASAPVIILQKKLGERWTDVATRARAHLVAKLGSGPFTLEAQAIFASGTR